MKKPQYWGQKKGLHKGGWDGGEHEEILVKNRMIKQNLFVLGGGGGGRREGKRKQRNERGSSK